MKEDIISQQYLIYIVIAIIMGSIARILTIIRDEGAFLYTIRQTPLLENVKKVS